MTISEWSEQIPTAKNAGEYTVWYKVQGNAEYADAAEQSVAVTVAMKAVTVTALDRGLHRQHRARSAPGSR